MDETNDTGKTELMLAVENDSLEAINAKISSIGMPLYFGNELFKVDHQGRSILFYVAARGDVKIAWTILRILPGTGFLCRRGKLLEMRDHDGLLAEEYAKMIGNTHMYELLGMERYRIDVFE